MCSKTDKNIPLANELQAHHCMTPEQWIWRLCNVSVILAKTMSLQEYKSIDQNQVADLDRFFKEIFGS